MRVARIAFAIAIGWALLSAAAAEAVPSCSNAPQARVLYSGYGVLESVIVDPQGRLYFTDTAKDRVMRAEGPGAPPQPFATGIDAGGGMAFDPATGDLLVGYGDSLANGLTGLLNPQAGIVRVATATGSQSPYVSGLQMANGVARGPDGAIYASTDVGAGIDRVAPGSHAVTLNWASVFSPNGLVVDAAGVWLYAAQTFQPPAISRVRLSDPARVETIFTGPFTDLTAGLDGMTRDENDTLYVAANQAGEIWQVDTKTGQGCALARGLDRPSAVAFGEGPTGFARQGLYAVTFGGEVVELPSVRAASIPNAPGTTGASPKAKRKCGKRRGRHGDHTAKRKRCKSRKHRR